MADKTDEEHLDNPTNIQPENLSDEITLTTDTETIALNQEPENMEVHTHPHHVTHKKKWGEYLLEFLMLFLAVFLGFVAENIREHKVEREREVKYVQSLIQDLKTDTINLKTYIDLRKEKRIMMDSLVMLLTTNMHIQLGNSTYYFARHVFNGPPFVSTDGTMEQLKNAGNLRLIKNGNVIKNILAYDALGKDLREWDESDTRIRTTFREIGGSIFNANLLYKAMDSNFKFVRPTNNPQLISNDLITINNVAFQIQYISLSSLGNTQRGKALKRKAELLIDLLKKEYNLE